VELLDPATCYRAVASRDRRFDGMFVTAVRSTGIYCRPSCPARTPSVANVTFHRTAAAAQAAGFRACKRCLPDAAPGSPRWDLAADTAGRAMRLIADGVVERESVAGLARRLGYSPRHLTRLLTAELGAGPLALARAHRAQNARVLLERTDWRLTDVAFAAGFSSVRQFNDTMREVYASTPTALRERGARRTPERRGQPGTPAPGAVRVDLRIAVRAPFDAVALWRFLRDHAVPGVEAAGRDADGDRWFVRSLRLPHGPATLRLHFRPSQGGHRALQVPCTVRVTDLRDVPAAIERCRRLLDGDCDPVAVDETLVQHPLLGPLVADHPGLRVPGHVDGDELAVRTLLGQQVSVAAANRLAAGLVREHGEPLPDALREEGVDRLFPTAEQVAAVEPSTFPGPRARALALRTLAEALAAGAVSLDRSTARAETRERLLALPGVGPWTASYVAMRALGDPDVFLPTDGAVRRRLRALASGTTVDVDDERWRPWRSYAVMHLWTPTSRQTSQEE
jgi:AraC family transcriptional regulator of adaptative response / DNA-3-methyladenine glycosylase II